jgi:YgiT-type zinc finger domain-containing protein
MNKTCNVCRGKLEKKLTTYIQWFEDNPIAIENVPAWVCGQCGETYCDPDVMVRIKNIVRSGQPPVRFVEALVYDLRDTVQ